MRKVISQSLNKRALDDPSQAEGIRLLKEQTEPLDNYIPHTILEPLSRYLNITIHIFEKNNPYKDLTWTSYGQENKNPEMHYFLAYKHQEPNNTYYPLHRKGTVVATPPELYKALLELEICQKQLQIIKNATTPVTMRISIWNANSLRDYHKRSFMLQKLYDANIQVALLQETMLTPSIQVYLKGYKIIRADSDTGRRGVAIIIRNTLDCDAYAIRKDSEGKFIKVKIVKEDQVMTISSVYIEPDMVNHATEVIPQDIMQSDIIAGDMNKAITTLNKIANVYHLSPNITPLTINQLHRKISDHPIIHATVPTPFTTKTNLSEINTLKMKL